MDKKFINENKFNEAINRFNELAEYKYPKQSLKHLYEFTIVGKGPNEADNELQPPQNGGGMNQQQPPQNNAPDASMQGGGMNGQMGGEMPPEGAGMPPGGNMSPDGGDMQGGMGAPPMDGMQGDMGAAPPMGADMQGDMGAQPMDGMQGGEPMGDMPADGMGDMQDQSMGEEDIDTTEMEPDDEVIDVDDLTKSQEATEYKIDGVDDRLSKIYSVVKKFSDQLDKQQQSIIRLKDEFEKRNPTQTEKFNLRSQASGPFNQTPTEYWDKVSQENPNYEIIRDNDVSPNDEQKEYEIKRGDISGLNMKNISDTLNLDQDLKKYIGF